MRRALASAAVGLLAACGSETDPIDVDGVDPGEWGLRAPLLAANSEFGLAEANGKLYVLGGYPSSRQTVRTVPIYDIASDSWQLGPPLRTPTAMGWRPPPVERST